MNVSPNGAGTPIDPKRPADRTQNQRIHPEQPVSENTGAEAPGAPAGSPPANQTDTVNLTVNARFVAELTETAAKLEEAPRQEVVDRISGQIASGAYNTEEVARTVAQSLLDSGLLTG